MSHSYKQPIVKDNLGKVGKRFASKAVRKHYCINGAFYKKMYNTWWLDKIDFRLFGIQRNDDDDWMIESEVKYRRK